jgi:hypothetical protein
MSYTKCMKHGWQVGDILEGDEGYGPDRIKIRAIVQGWDGILAEKMSGNYKGDISVWTLEYRDWKKVGSEPKATINQHPVPSLAWPAMG